MKPKQKARNSYLRHWIVALALSINGVGGIAHADDTPLALNGIAVYQKLKTEYYIGALYLATQQDNPDAAIFKPEHKKMVMKITIPKWRGRQFAKTWQQMISVNNDEERLKENSDSIIAFTRLAKQPLVKGDVIAIESTPEKGTTVSVNGQVRIKNGSDKLLSVLLSAWIGDVPPSSEFKRDMLHFDPTNKQQAKLLEAIQQPN
ncbi:Uncharacterised protein [BD1-7 clade bacterium]|uniref:Chalcone isomerase domain-containing protein n=1 Tax=BD1-7 clade bacterium TaxID=2029982 RepID=A0A5S9PTF2_9GAMM|nr:Uncharacterised protein [BD1-7 clade bacterium]